MARKKIDLAIIIVNYNGRFWLKKTLESVKAHYLDQSQKTVEVIVVDNNSSDDSVTLLKRSFRWVTLMSLDENLGFAAANNLAMKKVINRAEFIFLLNSDTELTEASNIDQLLAVFTEQKRLAVVTPRLLLSNGSIDMACHRGEPTVWASFTYFMSLEAVFPQSKLFAQYHQGYKDLNSIHHIDACSGAAMIVRSSAIKKVGYLDERFFMYAEDLDWCKRFREEGYTILYYPLVSLIHHKNKSGIQSNFKAKQIETKQHFYDTMLAYFEKHHAAQNPKIIQQLVRTFIKFRKGAL